MGKKFNRRLIGGVVALPTMLLVGGIMLEVGITSLFVVYYLSQGTFGAKLSAEALGAAQSGIEDALIKIIRNKNFSTGSGPNDYYALSVGNRSAKVWVCKDFKTVTTLCDTAASGKDEITSLGIAITKQRQLRAAVNVVAATGEVQVESLQETGL